jgi:2-oxoglutarate ferredoxin oxidoreductase subunit delta
MCINVQGGKILRKVIIDEARCKACGFCVSACPRNLIELGGPINQLGYQPAFFLKNKEDECISCALCAEMCPDVLIEVFKEEKKKQGES